MENFDILRASEIRDGATDFQDATVCSRTQAEFVDRRLQQPLRVFFHCAATLDLLRAYLCVGVNLDFLESLLLNRARETFTRLRITSEYLRRPYSLALGSAIPVLRFECRCDRAAARTQRFTSRRCVILASARGYV